MHALQASGAAKQAGVAVASTPAARRARTAARSCTAPAANPRDAACGCAVAAAAELERNPAGRALRVAALTSWRHCDAAAALAAPCGRPSAGPRHANATPPNTWLLGPAAAAAGARSNTRRNAARPAMGAGVRRASGDVANRWGHHFRALCERSVLLCACERSAVHPRPRCAPRGVAERAISRESQRFYVFDVALLSPWRRR